MSPHTSKHRHVVAAPIAVIAVMVLFGICNAVPLRAEVSMSGPVARFSAPEADRTFGIGRGVAGILRTGAALTADTTGSRLTLRLGQVLLRIDEPVTLDLGNDVAVSVFRGSLVAVRDAGGVTVAVLDAPVLLARSSELQLLQPGAQITIREGADTPDITEIGSSWRDEQMQDLALLPPPDTSHAESVCSDTKNASVTDLRDALISVLASGRITSSRYGCLREAAVLIDPSRSILRLALVALATEGARTDDETSGMIFDDVQNDGFLSPRILSLLPELAAHSPKPVQSAFLAAYPGLLIKLGLTDPHRAIDNLRLASDVPSMLTTMGLPLQADAWRSALVRSIVVLKTTVPDAERAELEQLLSRVLEVNTFAAASAPPTVQQDMTPKAPETHWTADELTAIAHDVLASHGALFATTTTLTPDTAAQTVDVEGIYVFQDGSNVLYAFTYDPALEAVTHIIRDGRRYPNAVPVRVFFGS